MKVIVFSIFVFLFSLPLFADQQPAAFEETKIGIYGHFKWYDQLSSRAGAGISGNPTGKFSWMDYDSFAVKIERYFGKNIYTVITPAFARFTNYLPSTVVTNNALVFYVYEAYFKINDIGCGISLKVGQSESPWYLHEKYYYFYRYIEKPIDYKILGVTSHLLGLTAYKAFLDNTIRVWTSYSSGEELLNPEKDGVQTYHVLAAFFPFANKSDGLKDLSFAMNIRNSARTGTVSSYNLLLGYKYVPVFHASLEYVNTYSSDGLLNKTDGASFFAAYNFYKTASVLFRYDYYDRLAGTKAMQHYILTGLANKFFENKLEAAISFDITKPSSGNTAAVSKRILVSTRIGI